MSEPDTRKITMQDVTIQAWPIDRLKPAENNHKKHTAESTQKLAKSMADIGQIQPVVVDKDGEIIAGHGRQLAAKSLGWDKIKVIQVPVDRATAIKARIADNLMSNQNLDQEKLTAEISELGDLVGDFDLGTMILDDGLAGLHDMNQEEDFGMDRAEISLDINSDVDKFSSENEEIMAAAGQTQSPLRKVFGFTEVSASQARTLKDFMAVVMSETGADNPADGLVQWVEEVMG